MKKLFNNTVAIVLTIIMLMGTTPINIFATETNQDAVIQYRYRNKEFSTSQTEMSDSWVLYDTSIQYNHESYKYIYIYHYRVSGTGSVSGYTSTQADEWAASKNDEYCFHGSKTLTYHYARKTGYNTGAEDLYLTESKKDSVDLTKYYYTGDKYWRFEYCTKQTPYTVYYYYKWSEWSEWSTTPYTATDDTEVETREIYTINYDTNGGNGVFEPQTKIQDENLNLSATIPTKEGFTFKGWSTSLNGTAEYNAGDICSVNQSITLYAVWVTTVSATNVHLDKSSILLTVGSSEELIATINPSNATNQKLTWSSSNSDVATVTDGTVTAIGKGSATITVTTADGGYTASCNVVVTAETDSGASAVFLQ